MLYLALISRKRERMHEFFTGVVPHLVVVGLCALLIAAQPDFSTAILVLVLVLMLYGGGARRRIWSAWR